MALDNDTISLLTKQVQQLAAQVQAMQQERSMA